MARASRMHVRCLLLSRPPSCPPPAPAQRHEWPAVRVVPRLAPGAAALGAAAAAGAAGRPPRPRRAAHALRPLHAGEARSVPARPARLSGGCPAARLRLLSDLRPRAGPALWGLHRPLPPGTPLPHPRRGVPAALRPHPGTRDVLARRRGRRDAYTRAGRYRAIASPLRAPHGPGRELRAGRCGTALAEGSRRNWQARRGLWEPEAGNNERS